MKKVHYRINSPTSPIKRTFCGIVGDSLTCQDKMRVDCVKCSEYLKDKPRKRDLQLSRVREFYRNNTL